MVQRVEGLKKESFPQKKVQKGLGTGRNRKQGKGLKGIGRVKKGKSFPRYRVEKGWETRALGGRWF